MKRFPSELEDIAVDFCHGDNATLAACGLVCRSWLPTSRYHLFSSITLTAQNVRDFLDIVTLSPVVPSLVQDVELRFSGISLLDLEVVPILVRLTRTARLTLRPARDEVTLAVCTSSLSRALPSLGLRHLKFDFKSRFESLQQVIACACLCPNLESLEVGGSWMKRGDFAVPPQLPKTLHTLILTCDLDYFLTWFMGLEDRMPVIQHLYLHHIAGREVVTVARYLQAAADNLKSLSLSFRDNDAAEKLAPRLDLAGSTALRDLQLEGHAAGVISCLAACIPQLNLRTTEITLTIRCRNGQDVVHAYPWVELDDKLRSTKRVTLVVIDPLTQKPRNDIALGILTQLTCAEGMLF
ncbi:hypothetical protein C8R45DRAFT_538614 [Mycena sanguinolenta]|nr:hypothetical protein C8R45DRAFT_538614 [Mycena sanguinolenta]